MPAAPLDFLEAAITMARVRFNDAIQSLAGDVITDVNPFTLYMINGAWRQLQELLVTFGYTWFKGEIVLPGVPPVGSADPSAQVFINWANYSNGAALLGAPVLPQDLITPLLLQERATVAGGSFYQMDRIDNGIPMVPKLPFNKSWEWRNGAIYMPGATQTTDIRLRFAAFFPDFVSPSTTPFSQQPIPVLRAQNALAWFICSEASKSRGDLDGADFEKKGTQAAQYICDLDPMQARSIQSESEYGKMPDQYSATMGPTGPRGEQGNG